MFINDIEIAYWFHLVLHTNPFVALKLLKILIRPSTINTTLINQTLLKDILAKTTLHWASLIHRHHVLYVENKRMVIHTTMFWKDGLQSTPRVVTPHTHFGHDPSSFNIIHQHNIITHEEPFPTPLEVIFIIV